MRETKRTQELNERLSNLYDNQKLYDTLLKYSKCDKRKLREKLWHIRYCINAVELELHREYILNSKEQKDVI